MQHSRSPDPLRRPPITAAGSGTRCNGSSCSGTRASSCGASYQPVRLPNMPDSNTLASVSDQWYPCGLTPLVEHVFGLNMRFGLWVEPEMVNPDSDLYRAHPDWALHLERRPIVLGRNQLVLDLGAARSRTICSTRSTDCCANIRSLFEMGHESRSGDCRSF